MLVGLPQSPHTGALGLLLDIKNIFLSFWRWKLGVVNNSLKDYCDIFSKNYFFDN